MFKEAEQKAQALFNEIRNALDVESLKRGDWRKFTESAIRVAERYLPLMKSLDSELEKLRRNTDDYDERQKIYDLELRTTGMYLAFEDILRHRDLPLFAFYDALRLLRKLDPGLYQRVEKMYEPHIAAVVTRPSQTAEDHRQALEEVERRKSELLKWLYAEGADYERKSVKPTTHIHLAEGEDWVRYLRPMRASPKRKVKA